MLEGEITDHLGYDEHDPAGKDGGNSHERQTLQDRTDRRRTGGARGARARDGSFEPKTVRKRQRRPTGVDETVISPSGKDPTTGEVQACWTMRWKTMLNAFDITFDSRLSAVRQ
ncbi:transposase [Streptomyces sp. Tu 3180]|uniref:transposase n=1 Tax=Streptomyces sp. Tu 3180 TaxID=2682611 RepID=UPI00135C8E06|nr:transposase [Streptomyces sp. Tu 3180]KAF3463925.1 hypothetical protein GL259_06170 [Streptomyces sp. Tu 3180]